MPGAEAARPPRSPRRAVVRGGAVAAGALPALPLVLSAQPAVAATGMGTCPLPDTPVAAARLLV
ncbi:hypothetical protein [Streptomyces halobius]|uniref:Uncharacterized protein n=1 Tax=Streptomyces halobius TaxID=2879846 RepID=A0ABY4M4Z4_9ACTN|nr:hypothetical protein [Streptomyces halobius]UQA91889.1 hypothetical protein K9S39_08495 [Streptomyces halobius]